MLLGVQSVGICGSDIHFWKNGRVGDYIVKAPLVMGHEASARVVAVGEGVTHLQKGQQLMSVCLAVSMLLWYVVYSGNPLPTVLCTPWRPFTFPARLHWIPFTQFCCRRQGCYRAGHIMSAVFVLQRGSVQPLSGGEVRVLPPNKWLSNEICRPSS